MFTRTQHIEAGYRAIKRIAVTMLLAVVLLSVLVVWKSFERTARSENRIYVLANGKAIEAFAVSKKDNVSVEARDHVKVFHEKFFTLDPDEKVIEKNISAALYLADASAKKQYESLRENGYYTSLIAGNISQEIEVDSVRVSLDSYPFYFKCFATQTIIRPSQIIRRSLITEGRLRHVSRSDHNPHGLLIEKWKTIENKDLENKNR
jgi:conjugative transposon TraK protein